MASKGKKGSQAGSSLWYNCEQCCCFICQKDIQEHHRFCNKPDSDKDIDSFFWKQTFIKDQAFYGFLEESKSLGINLL